MTRDELTALICFENSEVVALNKPAGLLVHEVAPDSLALTHFLPLLDPTLRPAHRLDRNTSGLLLCGRGPLALRKLGRLFMSGSIRKSYHARVQGLVTQDSGRIELALAKHNALMVPDESGPSAITNWRVLERRPDETLMELQPLTGRTHQLRAHMAALGHPIIGDAKYGGPMSERMWLHAYQLELPEIGILSAPLPVSLGIGE
jgi:tRNA pseudouridine32 synthase/23S rRNA pseudouridine746 synthase